jgi:hypothetical protein
VAGGHTPDAADNLGNVTRGLLPLIYAFRLEHGAAGNRFTVIKIGHTTNLDTRRRHLGAEWVDLLAIKPGTLADEQNIHRRIPNAHRAYAREYYLPTPQIIAMLDEWRAAYNLPPIEVAA